ncbi:endoribonuclease L-PSP [Caballeronia choica]|uniref:Endoribonuclease L-PSP n=1 Tax=Caballeronia choica TaxID=326476 RepID=A0A158KCT3_9BURK|nr:RidA family protein [Caballeronia choica]SAL78936.1 endoribonuclease L-PSP [Caballeronia choica]
MFDNHIVSIRPEWEWEHAMPPAPAVRAGNTVYLSGQIALGPDGRLVGEGDLTAQAHQCFDNIRAILQRTGGKMTDIVKLTTYFACELTENVTAEYWAVRQRYFGAYKPASTGVQVDALIYPNVLLEIEAIAVLPDDLE